MPSISDLIRFSSLVFTGVVETVGASNVSALPASADLVTVRVTRGLRNDPAVGDLRGRVVTVRSKTAHTFRPGESAVFFTRSWIHAEAVAVQEVARLDSTAEAETAAAVQALPDTHLRERLAGAELVVARELQRSTRSPHRESGAMRRTGPRQRSRSKPPSRGAPRPRLFCFPQPPRWSGTEPRVPLRASTPFSSSTAASRAPRHRRTSATGAAPLTALILRTSSRRRRRIALGSCCRLRKAEEDSDDQGSSRRKRHPKQPQQRDKSGQRTEHSRQSQQPGRACRYGLHAAGRRSDGWPRLFFQRRGSHLEAQFRGRGRRAGRPIGRICDDQQRTLRRDDPRRQ